ncbi:MAG TPA: succinate dehydrogenase cytochrome b subunit [Gemmataceae bacterium]|jgi:succinate dehydrogenase / fumarate reductase cytochrome b subunit|nr:succinate dehydrogenase cytochrome b subunit [Gemmataceae bacterium]
MSTVIEPRTSLLRILSTFVNSTIGAKYTVGITGLLLVGFVIAHMLGNLQVFAGKEVLNDYAQWLKDHGALLWTARSGLLLVFVTHIFLSLRLKKRNLDARPIRYQYEDTVQATWASRHMVLTGLLILAFVLFHLAHFTFGWIDRVKETHNGHETGQVMNFLDLQEQYVENGATKTRHDVYAMVIHGFRNIPVSIFYIIFQFILGIHLLHGTGSVFQTFGINKPSFNNAIRYFSYALTAVIVGGNISMPLAILFRIVK